MICWFENNNNNIGKSIQDVFLVSSYSSVKHGLCIEELNIRQALSLYVIRRLSSTTHINREDVYLAPKVSK
jgi:hypothetical protein